MPSSESVYSLVGQRKSHLADPVRERTPWPRIPGDVLDSGHHCSTTTFLELLWMLDSWEHWEH